MPKSKRNRKSYQSRVVGTPAIKPSQTGRLVWGKVHGSRIWPGIIVNHRDCGMTDTPANSVWVFWLGDHRVSQVLLSQCYDFMEYFNKFSQGKMTKVCRHGVEDAIKECRKRASLEFITSSSTLWQWALDGFLNGSCDFEVYYPEKGYVYPEKVNKYLKLLQNAGKLKNKDEFPVSSSSSSDSDSDAEERRTWKPKAAQIRKVRNDLLSIENICLGCDNVHCEIAVPHPCFEGGLCSTCQISWNDTCQDVANDGISPFCVVCSSPGEIFVCDNEDCDKVFCSGCIEMYVSPASVKRIRDTEPWHCFLCSEYNSLTHGLLKPRPDWVKNVPESNKPMDVPSMFGELEPAPDPSAFSKRPIRVLSLFDGIGTGLLILDKLQIEVEAYYACEIDEAAINVAKLNHGDKIQYLSDVELFTDKQIKDLGPIDLLIGGSPCNDLSCVNPARRGLYDPHGTGILFFHYYRIQKVLQTQGDRHLFWMFENVAGMPKSFKNTISLFLQRPPVVFDAKYFSPQKRPRFFWGNIPDMYNILPEEVYTQSYVLSEYLLKVCGRQSNIDQINCITTNSNSLLQGFICDYPVTMNGQKDVPWITEMEKIFGFPMHYTDVGNLGVRDRQILLGKSWSVPVVSHILSPLQQYFMTESDKPSEYESRSPIIVPVEPEIFLTECELLSVNSFEVPDNSIQ